MVIILLIRFVINHIIESGNYVIFPYHNKQLLAPLLASQQRIMG